eukprot:m51a1_g1944 putative protein kinase (1370) ;mRNA; f:943403-950822
MAGDASMFGSIYSVHVLSTAGNVLATRYFKDLADDVRESFEARVVELTHDLWGSVRPDCFQAASLEDEGQTKSVIIGGTNDLLFIMSGTGEYDELILSEAVGALIATIRQVCCSDGVSEASVLRKYSKVMRCIDETISKGVLHLTDSELVSNSMDLEITKLRKRKKKTQALFGEESEEDRTQSHAQDPQPPQQQQQQQQSSSSPASASASAQQHHRGSSASSSGSPARHSPKQSRSGAQPPQQQPRQPHAHAHRPSGSHSHQRSSGASAAAAPAPAAASSEEPLSLRDLMSSRCVSFPAHKVRPEIHEHAFARVESGPWSARDAPMGNYDNRRQVRSLTEGLLATFKRCNPRFDYKPRWTPPRRVLTNPSVPKHNESFDNENYDLILHVGDVLGSAVSGSQAPFCWRQGSRYTIVDMVGQGTFGQVVKCRDEEESTLVAVKVLKNKPAYFRQGLLEIGVLTAINTNWDRTGEHRTVRLLDHFLYQSHLCLVFELLSMNLFELIKQNGFRGVSVRLIRVFVRQILTALEVLDEGSVVHCDLKPENILLENLRDLQVKLIDFGSACFERSTLYTYIQSRHYRSPEVILGLPYSCAIDMWSLGCIAAELFLGIPLFPGANEYNQIFKITDMLGMPPSEMVERGTRAYKFFKRTFSAGSGTTAYCLKSESEYERENNAKIDPNKPYFMYRTLHEIVQKYPMKSGFAGSDPRADEATLREYRKSFEHFLSGVLQLDPAKRWTADQAIQHPFIQERPLPDNYQPPAARRRIALGSLPKPGSGGSSTSNLRSAADICSCYLKFSNALRAGQVIDATNGNVLASLSNTLMPCPGVAGSRLESDAALRRRARSEAQPPMSASLPDRGLATRDLKRSDQSALAGKTAAGAASSQLAAASSTAFMAHRGSQPPALSSATSAAAAAAAAAQQQQQQQQGQHGASGSTSSGHGGALTVHVSPPATGAAPAGVPIPGQHGQQQQQMGMPITVGSSVPSSAPVAAAAAAGQASMAQGLQMQGQQQQQMQMPQLGTSQASSGSGLLLAKAAQQQQQQQQQGGMMPPPSSSLQTSGLAGSDMAVDSPGGEPRMPRKHSDKPHARQASAAKKTSDDVSMSPSNWNPFFTEGSLFEAEQPAGGKQRAQQTAALSVPHSAAVGIPQASVADDLAGSTGAPRSWIGRGAHPPEGGLGQAGQAGDVAASWSQQQGMLMPPMAAEAQGSGAGIAAAAGSYGTQFPMLATSVSGAGLAMPPPQAQQMQQQMQAPAGATHRMPSMLAPPSGDASYGAGVNMQLLGTSAPGPTSYLAQQAMGGGGGGAPAGAPQQTTLGSYMAQQLQQQGGAGGAFTVSSVGRTAPLTIGRGQNSAVDDKAARGSEGPASAFSHQ